MSESPRPACSSGNNSSCCSSSSSVRQFATARQRKSRRKLRPDNKQNREEAEENDQLSSLASSNHDDDVLNKTVFDKAPMPPSQVVSSFDKSSLAIAWTPKSELASQHPQMSILLNPSKQKQARNSKDVRKPSVDVLQENDSKNATSSTDPTTIMLPPKKKGKLKSKRPVKATAGSTTETEVPRMDPAILCSDDERPWWMGTSSSQEM